MNNNSNKIIGYDPNTGQPIYETQENQLRNTQFDNTTSNANILNSNIILPNSNIQNQQYGVGQANTGQSSVNQNFNYNNQNSNNIYPNNQQTQLNNFNPNLKSNKINFKWLLIPAGVLLVILISVILLFLGSKETTRTFMIYMVGADLESRSGMATYELDGIDSNLVDMENVNVVLIAGGAKYWNNSYIDVDETSIYELTEDGFVKVKQQEIKNMGESDILKNFINYSYKNYKTDKYDLIFWNHGGAIMGSEFDEISNDNLSLSEISNALSKTPFNKKNKIETVIFSTCLNGSIEMANVFKDYADYFVASEEVSIGYPNTNDFGFINEVTTKDDGITVGKRFINKYKEKLQYVKDVYDIYNEEYNIYSTYSLVDLSGIEKLNNALNNFFEDIDLVKNYNTIARVRSNLYQYAYEQSGEPTYDMVDLYNLVYNLKDLSPTKADKVLKELENTVLYNYATNSYSRGISVYFPYNGAERYQNIFLSNYREINPIVSYTNFITDFKSLKNSNSINKLSFKNNTSSVKSENTEADFELELTDDQLNEYAKAEYVVFRDNKDGYYLPVYRGKEVKLEDNKLKAKIKDRQLKIGDDSYIRIITLIEDEVTDSYIKYSTYGVLQDISSNEIYEWKNDRVKISFILDKKTNKVQIGNVLLMSENDLPGKINVDIKKYTNLVLGSSSYKIIDENGNFDENWDSSSNSIFEGIDVDPNEDYKIELEDYSDGYDYYCIFYIYDVNNNRYYSNPVKMN